MGRPWLFLVVLAAGSACTNAVGPHEPECASAEVLEVLNQQTSSMEQGLALAPKPWSEYEAYG